MAKLFVKFEIMKLNVVRTHFTALLHYARTTRPVASDPPQKKTLNLNEISKTITEPHDHASVSLDWKMRIARQRTSAHAALAAFRADLGERKS